MKTTFIKVGDLTVNAAIIATIAPDGTFTTTGGDTLQGSELDALAASLALSAPKVRHELIGQAFWLDQHAKQLADADPIEVYRQLRRAFAMTASPTITPEAARRYIRNKEAHCLKFRLK